MRIVKIVFFIIISFRLSAQTADDVITKVRGAQNALKTVSYSLSRIDTLVTDDVRTMSGVVEIALDTSDRIFGFQFWARKDGETEERLYDGRTAYILNPGKMTYTATTEATRIRSLLFGGGGHLVFPELVNLQVKDTVSSELKADNRYFYLKLNYPDIAEESVIKRFKLIKIDRHYMLPIAMRSHQETYGKVQDLYYEVKDLRINNLNGVNKLNFNFLESYKEENNRNAGSQIQIASLLYKSLPPFEIESFDSSRVSSQSFIGNVTLIDLWELWCAPCITSMPRVDALYDTYKEKGLKVFGITSDKRGLAAARKMIAQKKIQFPILIGDEAFKKSYFLATTPLPMYILVDSSGKIVQLFQGFSEQIEIEIKRLLGA